MKDNKTITMVVLPESVWNNVQDTLREVKELLTVKNKEEVNNEYIESTEARKMLGVSPKTWQNYRDERRIPFVQFGRKIFVKRCDLQSFMEAHYISKDQDPEARKYLPSKLKY